MALKKLNYIDNQTVISAENMNDMQDAIMTLERQMSDLLSKPAVKIGEVTLAASGWSGAENIFSQIVTIEGVTANTQVDLTPSVEQLAIFYEKDLSFVTENDNGVVTVYAIGQKPQNDYTIQVTLTEVEQYE